MPNGENIAHGDGKEDNEERKINQTQNASIETSDNANIQAEFAEVDKEGEDRPQRGQQRQQRQHAKLRGTDVRKQNRTPTPRRNGSQTRKGMQAKHET